MMNIKQALQRVLFIFVGMTLFVGVFASPGLAYFFDIQHYCEQGICLEGEKAYWNLTLAQQGDELIEFVGFELVEVLNQSTFASKRFVFDPLSSERGTTIILSHNQPVAVRIDGIVPHQTVNGFSTYNACVTTAIIDKHIIARVNQHESTFCWNINFTMPVIQCLRDDQCGAEQSCALNQCKDLGCGSCQHVVDHACVDYECCASDQCGDTQVCKNNQCENIVCTSNSYIENRTCMQLNCGFDEFIFNRSCTKLDCPSNEYAFNHTCQALNCQEFEIIGDHTCIECAPFQTAQNNTCVNVVCDDDQGIENHRCVDLDCLFFQDATNNRCQNNSNVIFKLSAELIAIIAIITLLTLDILKYKKRNQPRTKKNKNALLGDI